MASLVIVRSRKREIRLTRWRRMRHRFSSDYWAFYVAAFFFDLGFGLFFFLYNLYLTDLHFDERAVGIITASLTLGNVVATFPVILLARRYGLKRLLLFSFVAAPLLSVARVLFLWGPAQIGLAFATGMTMCCWPICLSPAIAALTHERNRTSGFSFIFATGIGVGTLAGLLGGYAPTLLHAGEAQESIVGGIRIVLLVACGVVLLGFLPLWKVKLHTRLPRPGERMRFHPFLLRFLPPFLLWNVVTGSFPVFGAIYLQQVLKIPLGHLGMVFSASELAQFTAVLAAPILFRGRGLSKSMALAQLGTALFLVLIGATKMVPAAVTFYLAYNAMQYMCEPGIYNLLMNRIPEQERSTASAIQNLSGALCQAGTQAVTGLSIVHFGYRPVLLTNALFAVAAGVLFFGIPEQGAATETGFDQKACERG